MRGGGRARPGPRPGVGVDAAALRLHLVERQQVRLDRDAEVADRAQHLQRARLLRHVLEALAVHLECICSMSTVGEDTLKMYLR